MIAAYISKGKFQGEREKLFRLAKDDVGTRSP